jgi:hypothetical protein
MKGNFVAKARQLVLALLLVPFMSVSGTGFFGWGGGGCCAPVGCPPFDCGAFNFEVKGGVAPKIWTDRGHVFAVMHHRTGDAKADAARTWLQGSSFRDAACLPKFSRLHKVPWLVGVKLGYMMSCNAEVYFEFDYIQAESKCFNFNVDHGFRGTDGSSRNRARVDFRNISKLKEFAGYLGTRYYCDRWFCNTTSWFVGSKVGVSHHRARCFNFDHNFRGGSSNDQFPTRGCASRSSCSSRSGCSSFSGGSSSESGDHRSFRSSSVNLFDRNTSVSGGVHTGFDVRIWCGLSFVFTAEVVATCGPRGRQNVQCNEQSQKRGLSHFNIGSVGTEVTFPVTFGLNYSF